MKFQENLKWNDHVKDIPKCFLWSLTHIAKIKTFYRLCTLQLQLQLQLHSFTFNLQLHNSFDLRIGEPNRGGGKRHTNLKKEKKKKRTILQTVPAKRLAELLALSLLDYCDSVYSPLPGKMSSKN